VGGKDQTVEKGNAIGRLEKGHDRRGGINGILTREPVLERRSGDLELLDKLALTRTGMFLQGLFKLHKFAGDLFSCPGLFLSIFIPRFCSYLYHTFVTNDTLLLRNHG
jgi:hypothetical protein